MVGFVNLMAIFCAKSRSFGCGSCLIMFLLYTTICVAARSDKEIRERFYGTLVNASGTDAGDGSIANMFDRVLEKEFSDTDQSSG